MAIIATAGNTLKKTVKGVHNLLRQQKGMSILDVLLSCAILGTIGVVFISAIFAGYRASDNVDEDAMVQRLIRNQLEDIKNAPYDATAPYEYSTIDHPADYPISVDVESVWDNTRQDITITVSHEGRTLVTIDTFKVEGL